MAHKISHPQTFRDTIFFKTSSVGHLVFNGFFSKGDQIIRNTQRTTTLILNAIQRTVDKISRPQAFRVYLVFNGSLSKFNQIVKNPHRTTTSNWNAIQQTVHKISRPQAFRVTTLFKMSPVGHLVFNGIFSKVIQLITNT